MMHASSETKKVTKVKNKISYLSFLQTDYKIRIAIELYEFSPINPFVRTRRLLVFHYIVV